MKKIYTFNQELRYLFCSTSLIKDLSCQNHYNENVFSSKFNSKTDTSILEAVSHIGKSYPFLVKLFNATFEGLTET